MSNNKLGQHTSFYWHKSLLLVKWSVRSSTWKISRILITGTSTNGLEQWITSPIWPGRRRMKRTCQWTKVSKAKRCGQYLPLQVPNVVRVALAWGLMFLCATFSSKMAQLLMDTEQRRCITMQGLFLLALLMMERISLHGGKLMQWATGSITMRWHFTFEELSYCELDWKAEQIATNIFPGWKLSWANKQNRLCEETTKKSSKWTCQESVTHQKWFKGPESTRPASASLPPAALESAMPSIPLEVHSVFFISLWHLTSYMKQQSVLVINIIPNTPIRPTPVVSHWSWYNLYW